MTSRIAFVFVASVLFFHVLNWNAEATAIRRDVSESPTPKPSATQQVEKAFNDFKSGIDDLVKDIQGNKLYQDANNTLQNFKDQVKRKGEEFVQKFRGATGATGATEATATATI